MIVSNKAMLAAVAALVPLAQCEVICDDPGMCISSGNACTGNEGECCEDLGCFGFNFYKTCQPMPQCLEEWYDCSDATAAFGCCDGLVCADTKSGMQECQVPTIPPVTPGSRTITIELPDGRLVSQMVEEEPEDPLLRVTTTKVEGGSPKTACLSGDPHFNTFDGVLYDCQGHGEFIALKSLKTLRQVQTRQIQVEGLPVSVTKGIVIRDEGDVPKVQVAFPVVNSGIAQLLGREADQCYVQGLIDGQQFDIYAGYDDDDVEVGITDNGVKMEIKYKASDMFVTVEARRWRGACYMNICVTVPESDDEIVGLLGSPDREIPDWTDRDGVDWPHGPARWGDVPYDYCTENWCLKEDEEELSIFTYNQAGVAFEDFERCDMDRKEIIREEVLGMVTDEIERKCNKDMDCFTDWNFGGEEAALGAQAAVRTAMLGTCNPAGGECATTSCCEGLNCHEDGEAGKFCVDPNEVQPTCSARLGGLCSDDFACCEGMECQENDIFDKICGEPDEGCTRKGHVCDTNNDDCCGDRKCIKIGDEEPRCTRVDQAEDGGVCLRKGHNCEVDGDLSCCGGLRCARGDGEDAFTCQKLPEVWNKKNKNCDPADNMPPCGEGFTCTETPKKKKTDCNCGNNRRRGRRGGDSSDEADEDAESVEMRKVCMRAPTCGRRMDDCRETECCEGFICHEENKVCIRDPEFVRDVVADGTVAEARAVDMANVGTCASTTADGDVDKWDAATPIATMYAEGKPDEEWKGFEEVADAYMCTDCDNSVMCVYVKAREKIQFKESSRDVWFKDYEKVAKKVNLPGQQLRSLDGEEVKFIKGTDAEGEEYVVGWEQCYSIPEYEDPLRTSLEISNSYGEVGGRMCSVASTGRRKFGTLELLICPPEGYEAGANEDGATMNRNNGGDKGESQKNQGRVNNGGDDGDDDNDSSKGDSSEGNNRVNNSDGSSGSSNDRDDIGTHTAEVLVPDWADSYEAYYPLYNSGNSKQTFSGYEVPGYAFVDHKCGEDQIVCVLVKVFDGFTVAKSSGDSWLKDYDTGGNKKYNNYDKLEFIQEDGKVVGWKQCFFFPEYEVRDKIEIHANYGTGGNTGKTASTGKKKNGFISLDLTCG